MRLLRLYLSELRFHKCRWLEWRSERALRKGIALLERARSIRRIERIYLGLDASAPGSWRVPSTKAK